MVCLVRQEADIGRKIEVGRQQANPEVFAGNHLRQLADLCPE